MSVSFLILSFNIFKESKWENVPHYFQLMIERESEIQKLVTICLLTREKQPAVFSKRVSVCPSCVTTLFVRDELRLT